MLGSHEPEHHFLDFLLIRTLKPLSPKGHTMKIAIFAAAVAFTWTVSPADANGVQCWPYGPFVDDLSQCPSEPQTPQPEPQQPGAIGVGVGTGIGIGSGVGIGTGGSGGAGGSATGGNASIVQGGDMLSQVLRQAINIDNRSRAAASTAVASPCAGSTEGGCMSAAVQVFGFGVAVQSAKGFVGDHIVEAEERCKAGNPALAVYLHRFDRKAATAMEAAGCTVQGRK